MSFFIFACVTSVVAGFAIHVTKPLHIRYTAKGHSGSAVQSLHRLPTPRLGGLAILAGILPGVFLLDDHARQLGFWLLVSSIPVFLGGLGEDIGFDIKPTQRLLASLVSAALAGILFGYWVPYVDFPGLRLLTSVSFISVIITIIVSGGICHAVNLLDGLNELSICWAICAAIAMAVMALSVNDMAVFRPLILLIGASIGILFWNFPLGEIFLGDAGAYTLGHVLAWMALLLMNRHPEISPLALLLIFVWPITDMLLSMLRRKKSGRPIGQPDRLHFHKMVMRVLEIKFFTRARRNLTNPLGTLIILPMATVPMVLAIEFKTQTGAAFIAFCGFVALFVVTYSWALRRAGQPVHRKSRKLNQPWQLAPWPGLARQGAGDLILTEKRYRI